MRRESGGEWRGGDCGEGHRRGGTGESGEPTRSGDRREPGEEGRGLRTGRPEGWGLQGRISAPAPLWAAAVRQRGGTRDEWSRGGLVGIGKVFSLYMLIPTVLRTKMGFLAL